MYPKLKVPVQYKISAVFLSQSLCENSVPLKDGPPHFVIVPSQLLVLAHVALAQDVSVGEVEGGSEGWGQVAVANPCDHYR